MKYMDPKELFGAAECIAHNIKDGRYEDAYQWCLEVLNGLHGAALRRGCVLREAVEDGLRRMEQVTAPKDAGD